MPTNPKPKTRNPKLRREPARAAHCSLGEAIVRAQEQDMYYLGYFIGVVQAYPEYPHDWRTALATAKRVTMALNIAESLLRADHKTARPSAAGASVQAAA